MVYIICEDSKSAYKFWSELFKKECNLKKVKVISSNGIANFINTLGNIKASSGDSIILVFDWAIGDNNTIAIWSNIVATTKELSRRGIYVYRVKYTSFEELLIKVNNVCERTMRNVNNKYYNVVEQISKTDDDIEVYNILHENREILSDINKSSLETIYYGLLLNIMRNGPGRFKVNKSIEDKSKQSSGGEYFGECWYSICSECPEITKGSKYGVNREQCKNCGMQDDVNKALKVVKLSRIYGLNDLIELVKTED